MRKIFEKILQLRVICLVIMTGLTIFFGYKASQLKLYDDPNKWPPKYDSNVVLNDYLQDNFGGANVVTIQITVKEGDIFNQETLAKVKRITQKVLRIYGVVPYYVNSLNSLYVKYLKGSAEFLDQTPLMEDVPKTAKELERIKYGVYHNPSIYGPLVSPDSKSAVIVADFRTGENVPGIAQELPRTDPIQIYKEVNAIITPENDENHVVRCTGTPIIIGWVNSGGLPYIKLAFGFFILVVAIVLFFAFRNLQGIVLPILLGLVVCIWAFGLQCLFYGDVLKSSSVFIAPFILIAAVGCHTVQFLKRFFDEEYFIERGKIVATVETAGVMTLPLLMALVTDFMAFVVLACIPFDNVSYLGSVTMFGFLSIVICFYLFFLPLLSILAGAPKKGKAKIEEAKNADPGFLEKIINDSVVVLVRRTKLSYILVGALVVIVVWSSLVLPKLNPGQDNTYAIHNYLTKSWKNNSIYQMEMQIKENFKGIYPMNILIDTGQKEGLRDPGKMKEIDRFVSFLQTFSEVGGVAALPMYVKLMNRFYHEENDEYFAIPGDNRTIGEYLYFYTVSTPGAFDAIMDYDGQRTIVAAYLDSSSPQTVKRMMDAVRNYARTHFKGKGLEAKIAGGSIGIAEAFNDNITRWLIWGTLLSALASFLVVLVLLRSAVAGVLLLIPLFLGIVIWFGVMYLLGIEMNSNSTTALAIASGVGIDAEVYFLYRFREEFCHRKDFQEALIASFTRIRKALIFSTLALIGGCWALVPIPLYVGYVGFGMGLVLLVCFVVSFVVSPFLWSLIQPGFLTRGLKKVATQKEGCL